MCKNHRLEDFHDFSREGKYVSLQHSVGFATLELSAGDELVANDNKTNYLLALTEGGGEAIYFQNTEFVFKEKAKLPPHEAKINTFSDSRLRACAGDMMLVSSSDRFCFRATCGTHIVALAFDALPPIPQAGRFIQFHETKNEETRRVCKIKMGEVLRSFFQGLSLLIKESCLPLWLEKTKKQELFYIAWQTLEPETVQSFFRTLVRGNASFRFFVLSNYNADITVEQLVKMSGMCRTNFYRSFRKEFGTSVHNWMQMQRASSVRETASERGMNVKKLMKRHHFVSASNFIRFCRMHYNCSPKEMIRRVQGGAPLPIVCGEGKN